MATMTPEKIQARKDKAAANDALRASGALPPKKKSAKVPKEEMYTLIIKDGDRAGTQKLPKWLFDLAIADLKVPKEKTINIIVTEEVKKAINDAGNSQVSVYGGEFLIRFIK